MEQRRREHRDSESTGTQRAQGLRAHTDSGAKQDRAQGLESKAGQGTGSRERGHLGSHRNQGTGEHTATHVPLLPKQLEWESFFDN